VGPRAFLDAVVERKIPSLRRESNPRTPIIHPSFRKYGYNFILISTKVVAILDYYEPNTYSHHKHSVPNLIEINFIVLGEEALL